MIDVAIVGAGPCGLAAAISSQPLEGAAFFAAATGFFFAESCFAEPFFADFGFAGASASIVSSTASFLPALLVAAVFFAEPVFAGFVDSFAPVGGVFLAMGGSLA